MARYEDWADWDTTHEMYATYHGMEFARKRIFYQIQQDLYDAALDLGQTQDQAIAKIDLLTSTFPSEWFLWFLTEYPGLITAIQNDATIAWLDTEYPPASGVAIRQRIINRLNR